MLTLDCEEKVLLHKCEYESLVDELGDKGNTFVQTNYYFDRPDGSLANEGITCRIREKSGQYEATIKAHGIGRNGGNVEASVAAQDEKDITLFHELDVELMGSLLTTRVSVCQDDFEIALDKNEYLGCVDYELEVEYSPYAKTSDDVLGYMAELLYPNDADAKEHVCARVKKTLSKAKRFFERKRKLKRKKGRKGEIYDG